MTRRGPISSSYRPFSTALPFYTPSNMFKFTVVLALLAFSFTSALDQPGVRGGRPGDGRPGDRGPRPGGGSDLEGFGGPGSRRPYKGPRGSNRTDFDGPDFPEELLKELECTTEETIECGSPRLGEDTMGIFACRTIPRPFGEGNATKTVCVDPAETYVGDECGCCDGPCPTEACACACDEGEGYWMEPIRRFREEFEGDSVLVCVPQMYSMTAVASGRASCYEGCPDV
jgi:hypothetical protein